MKIRDRILSMLLVLVMVFSMVPAAAASHAEQVAELPAADILDVDFSTQTNTDSSPNGLAASHRGGGSMTYVWDEDLGKYVAQFDGNCGIAYPFSDQYDKIKGGFTFEVTFRYISLPDSKEHDLLSNQQAGGYGLGVNGGKWTFFLSTGSWKDAVATASNVTQWHHMVGTWDGSTTRLYIDGVLVGETAASGTLKKPDSSAKEILIAADSGINGETSSYSNACIANARVYGSVLSADQVMALAGEELPFNPFVSADAYAQTGYNTADTNVNWEPAVAWNTNANYASVLEGDNKPSNFVFHVDSEMNVTAVDGTVLEGTLKEITQEITLKQNAVPVVVIDSAEEAAELVRYAKRNRIQDLLVQAADISLLKTVLDDTDGLRGIWDLTAETKTYTEEEMTDLMTTANGSQVKILLLSEASADRDTVRWLQGRMMTVWAFVSGADKTANHKILTAGVDGVVTGDFAAVKTALNTYKGNNVLLRTPFVCGHRGSQVGADGSVIPENTVDSLVQAAKFGADAVECDIFSTKDGVLVLQHDTTTERMMTAAEGSHVSYAVETTDYQTLRDKLVYREKFSKDANGSFVDRRINTMEELFAAMAQYPDTVMYLEFVSSSYTIPVNENYEYDPEGTAIPMDEYVVHELKRQVEAYGNASQCVLITFDTAIMGAMNEHYPEMSVGYLLGSGGFGDDVSYTFSLLEPFNAYAAPANVPNENARRGMYVRGMLLSPWTKNGSTLDSCFVDGYMQAITTDDTIKITGWAESIALASDTISVSHNDVIDFGASAINHLGNAIDDAVFTPVTVSGNGLVATDNGYFLASGDTTVVLRCTTKTDTGRLYTLYSDPLTITATDEGGPYEPSVSAGITADILDVDFSSQSSADNSPNRLPDTRRGSGSMTYVYDETLNKHVAAFDGSSGVAYPMQDQYNLMQGGFTFETTFRYLSVPTDTIEHALLSNQQNGGFGLSYKNGSLIFFLKAGGVWRDAVCTASDITQWHHMVGVWDGSTTKLYLDGQLVGTTESVGSLTLPDSVATEVVVGADSDSNGAIAAYSNACIADARIYSDPLTAEQVAELAEKALAPESKPAVQVAEAAGVASLNALWSFPKTTITGKGDLTTTITVTTPDGISTKQTADVTASLLSGTGSIFMDQLGTYTIDILVQDAERNTAGATLTVMVVDLAAVVNLPAADVLDVDFADGTAADKSVTQNTAITVGSPFITDSDEFGKKIAVFNGEYDAYRYPFSAEKYAMMTNGFTMESVFCYDTITNSSSESDIFSSQQQGGIGFGVMNGKLTFFCNIKSIGWIELQTTIEEGKWYHVVGTFDGRTVRLFVNGELAASQNAGGTAVNWAADTSAWNFVLGGDADKNNGVASYAEGRVSLARLYSQPMTENQVALRYLTLEPIMIEISGATGSMDVNAPCAVPTAVASNGAAVTVAITDPDGYPVNAVNGVFTPVKTGDYTFTFTMADSAVKRVIVRSCVDLENPPVTIGLIAAEQVASGGKFNVAVHMNRDEMATVGKSTFTITYDPELVSYEGAEYKNSALTISDDKNGHLSMTYTGTVSTEDFGYYSATRLVKLTFDSVKTDADQEAVFAFEDVELETETRQIIARTKAVKLVGQSSLDLNGDGVIGAGDVALAETEEQQKLIAENAAIYPYKHAVVITIDGAGIAFRPDQMYYTTSTSITPTLTADESIMAIRKNPYSMSLYNAYCATSYSGRSETPTISAQNYTSIIHGKEYATALPAYKIDNTKTAKYYYPDFGKEVPTYPSIFVALGAAFPNRSNVAYAEWNEIVNGVVEPDAPVYTHGATYSAGNMQDVANYIRSDDWKNTAMIYMQSDEIDHVGHSTGYYNGTFYKALEAYDSYHKAIMDALEATGTLDETLVLFNSDHGGVGTSHGGTLDCEYDVQIALGGQTIDSGKKLTGGTNHDLPVLVLTALRGEVPASMDGTATLFEQASLNQQQLVKKNRDVETVTAITGTDMTAIRLDLSNAKHTVKTLDAVIALNGDTVTSVETVGTVVRQTVQNGKLHLTVAYAETPEILVQLNLSGTNAKVEEFMLGTDSGKEIYGDLVVTTGALQSDEFYARQVINLIDAIHVEDKATIEAARAAYETLTEAQQALVANVAKLEAAELHWNTVNNAVSLVLTGADSVNPADGKTEYTLSAKGMHNLATLAIAVEIPGEFLSEPAAVPADGWMIVAQVWKDGILHVVAANNDGANGDGEILTITAKVLEKAGTATVAVTSAEMGAYLGEDDETIVQADLTAASVTTVVEYNVYDVNKDGEVNLLDITRAQRYYGSYHADADVNRDNAVDIDDLIRILNNYTELFQ